MHATAIATYVLSRSKSITPIVPFIPVGSFMVVNMREQKEILRVAQMIGNYQQVCGSFRFNYIVHEVLLES